MTTSPPVTRNEWKVVVSFFLILVVLELSIGVFKTKLSKDLEHLATLPEAGQRLAEASKKGNTLLVVGNSLARNGIEHSRVSEEFDHVEFFYPDSSFVVQWAWGLRRYFYGQGTPPDHLWVVTGRTHLIDRPVAPEKLSAYYVSAADFGAAFGEMDGIESKVRFLLGRISTLFANRDRVRPLVSYRFLPGFEAAWPKLLAAGKTTNADSVEAGSDSRVSTDFLHLLLETAKEAGTQVTVVAIPLPDSYVLPDEVVRELKEQNVPLIDLTDLEEIQRENFPDGYHLDKRGAEVVTGEILRSLKGE